MYMSDVNRLFIFASAAGAPTNPAWYHNLLANPQATVEVGTDTFVMHASVIEGEERDQIYARQAKQFPGFAEYEAKTTRKIPVVALKY
jgi:deazaflavin-dependent oxidoreductase (nitroreductase family)